MKILYHTNSDSSTLKLELVNRSIQIKTDTTQQVLDFSGLPIRRVAFLGAGSVAIRFIDQEQYVSARDWQSVLAHQGLDKIIGAVYMDDPSDGAIYFSEAVAISEELLPQSREVAPAAPATVFSTLYSSAAEVRKRNAAKISLIGNINPLDSLAAIEKQVDLLTLLVLSLARKQPTAEQPAWLDELETVFADTSSVQEDALEKAVASMGEYKAHIRQLQETYFKNRE